MSSTLHSIIICPACDLVLRRTEVEVGERLICPRCGETLRTPKANSVEKALALSLTGLFLFFPAIFKPLMTLQVAGLEHAGSVWSSALEMIKGGYPSAGIMVLLTAVIIPLIKLLLLFWTSVEIYLRRQGPHTAQLFRLYHHLDEWGMLEVYLIGILVTIIKLMHMASIRYDLGFWCFIGLMATVLGSSLVIDEEVFWEALDRRNQAFREVKPVS